FTLNWLWRHHDSEVSRGTSVGSESTNSTLPFRRILWAALFMHPMVTLKRCANALSVRLFRICKARYNSTSPSAESVPDPKGRPRLRLSLLTVAFLQFAPLLGIHLPQVICSVRNSVRVLLLGFHQQVLDQSSALLEVFSHRLLLGPPMPR